MTTTATTSTEQYDDLSDLLDAHIDGDTHALDATGKVEKLNKHGNAVKTYANVGEFLDTLLRTNRDKIGSILNNFEDLTTPPTTPYILTKNTASETVHEIITNPAVRDDLINAYNNYAAPATLVTGSTMSADNQSIEYTYNGTAQTPLNIIEFVEELYLSQKISIANLNMVVQKLDRAQKKREKDAERSARVGGNVNIPGAPAGSPTSLQEVHEDLNVPQIQTALSFAKANKKTGSAYSFDKKWFPVRYESIAGTDTYYACIQDESGNVTEINATNTSALVREIMNNTKKVKDRKEFAETVDMETSFSRVKFAELCANVSKSKGKRGEYKLDGKNYFVHENLDTNVTPAASFVPPQYTVSYPGAGETSTTGTTLELHHGHASVTHESPTVDNLITFLEGHGGIHNPHHELDREHLLGVIDGIKRTGKRTIGYVINGHKYYMWGKKGKLYAEIPSGEHGKEVVSAWTKEGLYDKIIEKVQGGHAEKPAEHADKSKETPTSTEEHKEGHADAGHGDHGDSHDTVMDKTFKAILPGWLAKLATKGKNIIPEKLRNLTTYSVLGGAGGSAVITGGIYGLASTGAITMGTKAALGLFGPIGLTIGGGIAAYKAYRWWKGDKKDKDAHGGGH